MAARKTGFLLGAVAGAGVLAAALAGVALRTPSAYAQPAPTAAPPGAPLSFADIFDRVSPAVVSINVTTTIDPRALGIPGLTLPPRNNAPGARGRGQDNPDDQDEDGQGGDDNSTQAMASGSGFFISADGYIVTNNHVVENAKDIKVVLPGKDQRELPAKVIGHDEGTDLAVIKVEGGPFPFVNFENSARPRVGDWVIAVGNPFGLGGTATAGIVSAYGRDIGEKFVDYIQIDAPVNRGNSGGPTFDIYGRVIGINTMIFSPTGGSVGIGFDIPADVAEPITKQLISGGKISRGYLGATIQDVSPEIAESLGKAEMKGALVDELSPGGPAEKSGLMAGDIVVSVNGVPVKSATELTRQVAGSHTGDILRLSILREGQSLMIAVKSGLRPSEADLLKAQAGQDEGGGKSAPTRPAPTPGALGITFEPIDATARQRLGIPTEVHGALIEGIDQKSDAYMKGLRPGDVVLRVNDRAVVTGAEVAVEVAAARKAARTNVLLFVYHDHHQQAVPIKIEEDGDSAPPARGRRPSTATPK